MTSVHETHLKWVEKLKERGETVLQPKHGNPMGHTKGYIKTQRSHKDAGAIFEDKHGTFGLFGDMGALHITGITWEDLGLCDARCRYEWMDSESYQPKNKPFVNVFGERICDKTCPAYHNGEYGELCNAKLDRYGRVKPVDGKAQNGMVCQLPIGFRIVMDE